jgi:hypothetical protein
MWAPGAGQWPALHVASLQDRLIVLQDRIENMMRARYGLPDRDAVRREA